MADVEVALAPVLALNERGLGFLADGDYQSAAVVFRNALQQFRMATEQQEQQPPGPLDAAAVPPITWKVGESIPAAPLPEDGPQGQQELRSHPWRAFNEGLAVSCVPSQEQPSMLHGQQRHEILLITLLYNTALAYDLRRRRNFLSHLGSTERASRLYEQVLSVMDLLGSAAEPSGYDDSDLKVALMATVNNRAGLAVEEGDDDTFETYRSLLEQMIRPSDMSDNNVFASNLLLTSLSTPHDCPAAPGA